MCCEKNSFRPSRYFRIPAGIFLCFLFVWLGFLFFVSGLPAQTTIPPAAESESSGKLSPALFQPDGYHLPLAVAGPECSLPNDNPYFPNLKITASEEISFILEVFPKMITFSAESLPADNRKPHSVAFNVSGLEPFLPAGDNSIALYRQTDGNPNLLDKFTFSSGGVYQFTVDFDQKQNRHQIVISPQKSTIYIRGRDNPGDEIVAKGVGVWLDATTCQLTKDITEQIIIDGSNLTIDGNGFTLTGPGFDPNNPYGYGGIGILSTSESDQITIKNLTIKNFYYGIDVWGGTDHTFENMALSDNFVGINSASGMGRNFRIINCTVSGLISPVGEEYGRRGVMLYSTLGGGNHLIQDCTINGRHWFGLALWGEDNRIINCASKNNSIGFYSGFDPNISWKNNIHIKDCRIENGEVHAILLHYGNGSIIENNEAVNCAGEIIAAGLYFTNQPKSINLQIKNNRIISNTGKAIYLEGTQNSLVTQNVCADNQRGLVLDDAENITVTANSFIRNAKTGLRLLGPINAIAVYHNNIYDNAISNVESAGPVELSCLNPAANRNEGNYWGKNTPPGFYPFGSPNLPYDSNAANVNDSYPYLVLNGWLKGYIPGEPERLPGKIIFDSNRDGNLEIYRMDADGRNVRRLTNHPALDSRPVISPDGSKVAWQTERDANGEIYLMNIDGANPVNLTNHPGDDHRPAFSPDGQKIAFHSDRDGSPSQIYVMPVPQSLGGGGNVDGANPVRLTNDPAGAARPVFSPDGTKIAFHSGRDGNREIYIMNGDGTNQTRLTNHPAEDSGPFFSPDGTTILWHTDREGNYEIYRMNANGDNPVNLTNHPTRDQHPATSPDGRKIVFDSDRNGNDEIYVMNPDGTGVINLTNHPAGDNIPDWGPEAPSYPADTTPPIGSISINASAPATSSTAVTLLLFSQDPESGVTQMRFSNDAANWTAWMPYLSPKTYNLSPPDGTKTVYVEYKNGAGLTAIFSDTIILDTTPPVITAIITPAPNAAGWNNTDVTVSFSATDELS
ncbi:MAG: right-handed parallel beta-helix repeat-containing protein, partial [Planctomycetota bacterium]